MSATSLLPSQTIALLAPMPELLLQQLQAAGHQLAHEPGPLWQQATVAITRGSLPTGAAQWASLPQLRLLCCWGSGYDGIDLQAAAKRGVTICRAPGGNSASVADLAMGLVIALLRHLPAAQRHVRSGDWHDAAMRLPASPGLTATRLGVFGVGEVGRKILTRARAFEMELACCSRRDPELEGIQYFAQVRDLAQWCDVLVLAVRADASTHHAINREVLLALGAKGHLVNVARGSVVDEAALCQLLQAGQLGGFASDVFEHEPQIPAAILQFPNTVLTPHIGGSTQSAQKLLVQALMENLQSFLRTGRVVTEVVAASVSANTV